MTKQKQKDEAKKIPADRKTADEAAKFKQEAEEYRNKYLRALADYQNLENRMRKDKDEAVKATRIDFLNDFLPFLDNLEMAEAFNKDPGLGMIKAQLQKTIAALGFGELDVMGKPFDPNSAEAIDIIPGEKDDIVVEVIRKGYVYGDRLVRPAQVKVSKKIEARDPKTETKV